MSIVLAIRRIIAPALVIALVLATPVAAYAEDPPSGPETIYATGFESADSLLTLQPTPGISSSAYWGAITQSKRTGSYGLWCAGSNPSNWDPALPAYLEDTRGQALIDMSVLADYYDSWLEYWYVLPSRGGGDANSFNVGWWANSDPGDWDTFNYFGTTSTWTSRVEALSDPFNSPGISREAATLIFEFNDKVDTHGSSVGQGATVDDVTVTGYMFGPARSLSAAPGSDAVSLSWDVPWSSRDLSATDSRSIKYRIWRRTTLPSVSGWTEVTPTGGTSSTTFDEVDPPTGVELEYQVHPWEDGGSGYGAAQTVSVNQPPTVASDALDQYNPGPASITITASDAVDGMGSIYYILDGDPAVQTPGGSVTVPDVSSTGLHMLTYWAEDAVGVASDPVTHGFIIGEELEPPVTTHSVASTGEDSRLITLTAEDFVSEVDSITYTLDGAPVVTTAADTVQVPVSGFGDHTITYWAQDSVGNVEDPNGPHTISISASSVERLAGDNRFATAVAIAREGWGNGGSDWSGVSSIIIASGDDQFAADPLTASGLSWAYDAPLFLVSSLRTTPSEVLKAVKEVADDNGSVKVYVVGGTTSVPAARVTELKDYIAANSSGSLVDERVAGTDRYKTAEKIARKVMAVHSPDTVLVANGANPASFYDALALSPIAAQNGYPILPVTKTSVPDVIDDVLADISPSTVIIGGGTAVVEPSVATAIKNTTGTTPDRWSGANRYETATTIASNAVSPKGWLDATYFGAAAGLPDALTGGSMVGAKGGPLVLTSGTSLTSVTGNWIAARKNDIAKGYVFGGTAVVEPSVKSQIEAKLGY